MFLLLQHGEHVGTVCDEKIVIEIEIVPSVSFPCVAQTTTDAARVEKTIYKTNARIRDALADDR